MKPDSPNWAKTPQLNTKQGINLETTHRSLLKIVARLDESEYCEAEGNLRMAATVQSMAAYESCKTLVEQLGLSK
ncbi:MAG: hypothetical protein F9K27_12415 [Anaerolineae bacterium]|nr:MAG: hypothetical protein F9K27_12415 [Anaerolineae bacterium]